MFAEAAGWITAFLYRSMYCHWYSTNAVVVVVGSVGGGGGGGGGGGVFGVGAGAGGGGPELQAST